MGSKNTKDKNDNYIEEIKEWQEHQYEPGYYSGGKIPPFLKHPGKPMIIGLLYIISGIICIFLITFPVAAGYTNDSIGELIIPFIMFGGIGMIFILAGVRFIKKAKMSKISKKKL